MITCGGHTHDGIAHLCFDLCGSATPRNVHIARACTSCVLARSHSMASNCHPSRDQTVLVHRRTTAHVVPLGARLVMISPQPPCLHTHLPRIGQNAVLCARPARQRECGHTETPARDLPTPYAIDVNTVSAHEPLMVPGVGTHTMRPVSSLVNIALGLKSWLAATRLRNFWIIVCSHGPSTGIKTRVPDTTVNRKSMPRNSMLTKTYRIVLRCASVQRCCAFGASSP